MRLHRKIVRQWVQIGEAGCGRLTVERMVQEAPDFLYCARRYRT